MNSQDNVAEHTSSITFFLINLQNFPLQANKKKQHIPCCPSPDLGESCQASEHPQVACRVQADLSGRVALVGTDPLGFPGDSPGDDQGMTRG